MPPKANGTAQRGSALKVAGRSSLTVNGRRAASPQAAVASKSPSTVNTSHHGPRVSSAAVPKPAASSAKTRAATRLQAWFRGYLARQFAIRQRIRAEQRKLEDQYEREEQARREAAAKAKLEAEAAARDAKEKQKEAKLRAFRDRRGAVELMCQHLPCQDMPWEEDACKLMKMLEGFHTRDADLWVGSHTSRRLARKKYLMLARKWHPDKWGTQGDAVVGVATDVTKYLILSYEHLIKTLPLDDAGTICRDDDDEDVEVWEFASWVGVAFEGMAELYKMRKGVTRGA